MNTTFRNPTPASRSRGFALIATISVMVLLVMVALAMLSLSTIETRQNQQGMARAEAQANARMALMIAIGELQKYAGRDQRVTATAQLHSEAPQHPHWTGVWSTMNSTSLPVWLVSGNENAPISDLDTLSAYPGSYHKPDSKGDYAKLFSKTTQTDKDVLVPRVSLTGKQGGSSRYAWWVSDEGTKARIDLGSPGKNNPSSYERIAQAASPIHSGLPGIDTTFSQFTPDSDIPSSRYVSIQTTEFNMGARTDLKEYLHDVTTGGFGLPVNPKTGKMKTDLSIVFDNSTISKNYDVEYLGAKARSVGQGVYDFQVSNPSRFYFVDELSKGGEKAVGPNWGNLYNYGKLFYRLRSRGGSPATQLTSVAMRPSPQTDIRTNTWAPYQEHNITQWKRDVQHTNSPITPVCSHLQMGFRLKARSGATYVDIKGRTKNDGYQMQVEMKPVVGLWNPYNVKIRAATYQFDWALYPYLRLAVADSSGRQIRTPSVWMREHWLTSSGGSADNPESSQNKWFRLQTPSIDLEPGEFRLFSVKDAKSIAEVNTLSAGWNEEGAFTFDLVTSKAEAESGGLTEGDPVVVPPRSVAWYGDLFIEDGQHAQTSREFPQGFLEDGSASWFTLKTQDYTIQRVSDLWLTPRKDAVSSYRKFYVPEQLISDWVRTGSSSPKVSVEQLAASPWHIGTWSWSLRTTTDASEAPSGNNSIGTQSLRGWVDCNPRYTAANPRWDGSRLASDGSYDGWYFISPMIGGSHPDRSWNGYDGSSSGTAGSAGVTEIDGLKGRGMIAIGQLGDTEPQVSGINRYQGYGGNSTAANGQNHTAIYDVPRTGLISIGQFQHAQLARYNYEPGFIVGNSYANIRVPLDQTIKENFNDVEDFNMVDTPYHVNELLWDDYFFSTIGTNYSGGTGSIDSAYPLDDLRSGNKTLFNPRYKFMARTSDVSISNILDQAENKAPEAIASRIRIPGAFNVNSTSKAAWKAILSSMQGLELPVISEDGSRASWEKPDGTRIPRFSGYPTRPDGWEKDGAGADDYWRSYRRIGYDELDALAEEIVKEVKERGPFRSLAAFVNRDPESKTQKHQVSGALQTALDETLNKSLSTEISSVAKVVGNKDENFSDANQEHSQAAGTTSYALQGDLLQALGPILQVRSDYFRIRCMGESLSSSGQVIARAYCEAFVQRHPDYVDNSDEAEVRHDDLTKNTNLRFGRRFKIVSFRWLSDSEI